MPNPNRRNSVVVPIVLIVIGGLFLLRTWRPEFNPWSILWTYWPLILIAIGLGKIWDYSRRRQVSTDPNAPGGGSGSSGVPVGTTIAVVAVVLIVVAALWHGGRRMRARDF